MKAFWALLKLNFKKLLLTTFNAGQGKRKAASGIGAMVLVSVLSLYLAGTYAFLLASGFAVLGGLDVMLMLMVTMALAWPLMINIFAAQSLVFGTRDIDLILSFPVSPFSIMLARILALYLEILLMVELMLLPTGAAWLMFGGSGGALFMVLLLVLGAFLALLPTAIGLVFGFLVSLFASRMRFKNLFTVLFSLFLIAFILVGSTQFGAIASTAQVADINAIRTSLLSSFPPLGWVVQAVTGPHIGLFLALAVGSVAPLLLLTWLFSRFYKALLTKLSTHAMRANYKMKALRSTSPFMALLGKEARRFFGTPAYILNMGISCLIVIGASIFAATQRSRISYFLSALQGPESTAVLAALLPYFVLAFLAFFQLTCFSSAVSVSLEGKTLWILKAAPLPVGYIFGAKAGLNVLLNATTTIISVPLLAYAFSLAPLTALYILILCLLFGAFTSCLGLFINLCLPRLDADNDTMVIKQSSSGIISMLAALLAGGVVGVVAVPMYLANLSFGVYVAVAAALLALLLAASIALLATKGQRLFAAL